MLSAPCNMRKVLGGLRMQQAGRSVLNKQEHHIGLRLAQPGRGCVSWAAELPARWCDGSHRIPGHREYRIGAALQLSKYAACQHHNCQTCHCKERNVPHDLSTSLRPPKPTIMCQYDC